MANSSEWTSESFEFNLAALIKKYSPKGILVDTNLLVLLLGTEFDPTFPGSSRASEYSTQDAQALAEIVSRFGKVVSTQHVMAESSNLLRQAFKGKKQSYLMLHLHRLYCTSIPSFSRMEIDVSKIDPYIFQRLGFTDSALAVASGQYPLITADLDLHVAVSTQGGDSVNFWHLKEALLDVQ